MENKNVNVNSSKGISVCGLLTSVLVVLKALGYISCAWWICFLPIIISVGLSFLIILMLFIAGLIMA